MIQSAETPDLEVVRIEDSFNNLLTKVGTLVNHSVVLVSHFHRELDQALRTAFSPEADRETELMLKPSNEGLDSDFLQGVGLDDVLESFFDFGRSVMEEFGAVITQVFSDLHDSAEDKNANEGAVVLKCTLVFIELLVWFLYLIACICSLQRRNSSPDFCKTRDCAEICADSRQNAGSCRESASPVTEPCSLVIKTHALILSCQEN